MKTNNMKFNTFVLGMVLSSAVVAQVDKGVTKSRFAINQQSLKVAQKAIDSSAQLKAMSQSDTAKKELAPAMRVEKSLKIEIKKDGVANGGGGVSAEDGSGHRRLLDLIEKDEIEYFYPGTIMRGVRFDGAEANYYKSWDNLTTNLRYIAFSYEDFGRNKEIRIQTTFDSFRVAKPELGGVKFVLNLLSAINAEGRILDTPDYWIENGVTKPLRWAFVDMRLESVNDEGAIRIENPETRKQVAIQKDGLVLISRPEFNAMDPDSKNALFIHESALRAVLLMNPSHVAENGTEKIRTYTRRIYKYLVSPGAMPPEAVMEAFLQLGIPMK